MGNNVSGAQQIETVNGTVSYQPLVDERGIGAAAEQNAALEARASAAATAPGGGAAVVGNARSVLNPVRVVDVGEVNNPSVWTRVPSRPVYIWQGRLGMCIVVAERTIRSGFGFALERNSRFLAVRKMAPVDPAIAQTTEKLFEIAARKAVDNVERAVFLYRPEQDKVRIMQADGTAYDEPWSVLQQSTDPRDVRAIAFLVSDFPVVWNYMATRPGKKRDELFYGSGARSAIPQGGARSVAEARVANPNLDGTNEQPARGGPGVGVDGITAAAQEDAVGTGDDLHLSSWVAAWQAAKRADRERRATAGRPYPVLVSHPGISGGDRCRGAPPSAAMEPRAQDVARAAAAGSADAAVPPAPPVRVTRGIAEIARTVPLVAAKRDGYFYKNTDVVAHTPACERANGTETPYEAAKGNKATVRAQPPAGGAATPVAPLASLEQRNADDDYDHTASGLRPVPDATVAMPAAKLSTPHTDAASVLRAEAQLHARALELTRIAEREALDRMFGASAPATTSAAGSV